MAYNEVLAQRIRKVLKEQPGVVVKKMFGGVAFMVWGNMCCGVIKEELVVRVGPEHYNEALAQPYARPMDFTGWPIKGMVFIGSEGYKSDESLKVWVGWGLRKSGALQGAALQ